MNMKRIRAVTVAAILAAILIGCGTPKDHRMRVLERVADYEILVDTDTGVCYIRNAGAGGFCVMVDHNGNPYIANGWRDWSDGDALY